MIDSFVFIGWYRMDYYENPDDISKFVPMDMPLYAMAEPNAIHYAIKAENDEKYWAGIKDNSGIYIFRTPKGKYRLRT